MGHLLTTMSPEKQRIAIAKACGWKRHADGLGYYQGVHPALMGGRAIPNYLTDLNAMHEVESKSFNTAQREDFACHLLNIVAGEEYQRGDFVSITRVGFILTHATASQHAEAFLRTLGLWEEQ